MVLPCTPVTSLISLFQVVQGLRECRSGLVEDRFQFEFCHQVLFEALTAPKGDASPVKRRKADHKQEARSKKKGTGRIFNVCIPKVRESHLARS